MNRNTVMAIVLSALVIFSSLFIQQQCNGNQKKVVNSPSVTNTSAEKIAVTEKKGINEKAIGLKETYEVKTEKAVITFTNEGGDITSYKLVVPTEKEPLEILNDVNHAFTLNVLDDNQLLSSNYQGYGTDEVKIERYANGTKVEEEFSSDDESQNYVIDITKDDDAEEEVKISFIKNFGDYTVSKTFTIKDNDNVFKMDVNVVYNEGVENKNLSYNILTTSQIFPGANYRENRYEIREFVAKKGSKEISKVFNGERWFYPSYDWAGVAGKYFTVIAIPDPKQQSSVIYPEEERYKKVYDLLEKYNGEDTLLAIHGKKLNSNRTDSYYFYAGPRSEEELLKYNKAGRNQWGIGGLELNTAAKGSFLRWIQVILKWMLETVYKLVRNWGVAIIIVTIILRIILFPLNKKSAMGQIKMQELQPKMVELQQKYKNNKQQLNLEMAKLYKKVGYNPISGCLPMIVQIIIFIAMYRLFDNYYEFRGAKFISGWIDDLSVGDIVYKGGRKPIFFITWAFDNTLRLLPILYTASQIISSLVTQRGNTASTGQMKFMMYGLPLIFFFLFYNAPSGLLLYWLTSNLFQIGQQVVLNKIMMKKRAELAKNTPKLDANEIKFKGGKKKTR